MRYKQPKINGLPPRVKDLRGTISGKLTVTDFAYAKNGKMFWRAKCTCGGGKIVRSEHVNGTKGNYQSTHCGCVDTGDLISKAHAKRNGAREPLPPPVRIYAPPAPKESKSESKMRIMIQTAQQMRDAGARWKEIAEVLECTADEARLLLDGREAA